jgi:hypothetical protein
MQSADSPGAILWFRAVFKSAIVATNNGDLAVPVPLVVSRGVTSETCCGVGVSSFVVVDVSSALTKIGHTNANKKSKANPLSMFRNSKILRFTLGKKSSLMQLQLGTTPFNNGTRFVIQPFICSVLFDYVVIIAYYFLKVLIFAHEF